MIPAPILGSAGLALATATACLAEPLQAESLKAAPVHAAALQAGLQEAAPPPAAPVHPGGSTASARPWTVAGSWTLERQELRFESDGITLAGTLHVPRGAGQVPAVVMVQQAGSETRDDPFHRQVAHAFHALGYAVLLYDRRGRGESGGEAARPDYATLAGDAVAALRAVRGADGVDPARVGFWGISQGGWLAMEAAGRSDPAFVISVSAPLTPPGEQMEFRVRNAVLVRAGEQAADRALAVRRIVMTDRFRGEASHEAARAALASIEHEPWFEQTFLPAADDLPEDVSRSPWNLELAYDPVAAFAGVRAPMLFLLGGDDPDVPVARTLEILATLGPRPEVDVVVLPDANHGMRIGDDPARPPDLAGVRIVVNSGKFFTTMGAWLARLDRPGP